MLGYDSVSATLSEARGDLQPLKANTENISQALQTRVHQILLIRHNQNTVSVKVL